MDAWLPTLQEWIRAAGPWAYAVLFLAALVEYVFPPFPGDTVVLLGGAYAAVGAQQPVLVFVAVTAGGAVGIAVMHRVGFALADRLDRRAGGTVWGIPLERLAAAQRVVRERGDVVLVVNRFFPTLRALVFVAAGAARTPFPRTLALGLVSAALWNAALVTAGYVVGDHLEQLDALFTAYRRGALVVLAVAVVAALAWAWARRRARR